MTTRRGIPASVGSRQEFDLLGRPDDEAVEPHPDGVAGRWDQRAGASRRRIAPGRRLLGVDGGETRRPRPSPPSLWPGCAAPDPEIPAALAPDGNLARTSPRLSPPSPRRLRRRGPRQPPRVRHRSSGPPAYRWCSATAPTSGPPRSRTCGARVAALPGLVPGRLLRGMAVPAAGRARPS